MICFDVSGVNVWKKENKRCQLLIEFKWVWIDFALRRVENTSPIHPFFKKTSYPEMKPFYSQMEHGPMVSVYPYQEEGMQQ